MTKVANDNHRTSSQKTLKYNPKEEDPKPLHQDFFYKPRRKAIDWRMLSSINIDEITRDNNISILQKCIDNITFCDIYDCEEMKDTDPNLVKMFQLSQLIIEFLLHSQKFLISDKEATREQMDMMANSLSTAKEQYEKTKRVLEEKQKEIKALKKALFAFELMAKNPQKQHSSAEVATFHRCRYCTKAFSSEKYLQAHELRRHGDILSDNEGDLSVRHKPKETPELKKVVELIEKFTNQFSSEKEKKEVPKPSQEEVLAERLKTLLEQEKLKFENELQSLKTAMHREIEEEREILVKDRKAFESLVNSNSKILSHVGELEEDEESRHSKSTRNESTMQDVEIKLNNQIEMIRSEMLKENVGFQATRTMSLEKKLEKAAEEIARLRAEKDQSNSRRENMAHHAHAEKGPQPPKLNISAPPQETPLKESSTAKSPRPMAEMEKNKSETWKKYVAALKQHNNVPNPHAKWATSKYHHPVGEMQSEKELLAIDIDQFLAERGITDINIAKLSTDPTLKAITAQLSDYINGQRQASSQIEFYDEMRAYLENQVESAAAVAFNMDNVSPIGGPPVNRPVRKSISTQFQTSPTRSSIRKISSNTALPKNVKLAEVAEERVIIPKTVKTSTPVLSPLKGLDVSVQIDPIPANYNPMNNLPQQPLDQQGSPMRPTTPLQLGEPSSPTVFSSVKNAFSMIAKSLTSPSRAKPNYGAQFDQAMRTMSPPTGKPALPPREPKKYLDIPREPIKSVSTTSQTGSSTGVSSEEDTSETDQVVLPASPAADVPAAKVDHKRDPSQSETSFSVSELSDTGESRRILDFDHHNRDIDAFDIITEEDENLPPLTIKNNQQSNQGLNVAKKIDHISDDDDVLEFLDEIDASLEVRTTGKAAEVVELDDIDDFDN